MPSPEQEGPRPLEKDKIDSDKESVKTTETLVDDRGNPTEDVDEGVYQIEED